MAGSLSGAFRPRSSRRAGQAWTCSGPRRCGGRDAVLVHYFDQSITAGQFDAMSDALAVALQRRGVRARRSRGDVSAEHPAGADHGARGLEVRRGRSCRAIRCCASASWSRSSPIPGSRVLVCQDDLYAEVAQAALPVDRRSAHDHHVRRSTSCTRGAGAARRWRGATRLRSPGISDLLELVERHRGEVPEPIDLTGDDVAFMVYTSGTTGEPKAAMNTHRNVVFATVGLRALDRPDRGRTAILGLAPLFHVTGLIGHVTLALLTGSPLVLFYRFDAGEACRLTEAHRATFTVSAVTAFIALLNSEAMGSYDLSSLTKVYTGGAPTPPGVLDEWHRRTGARIQPMYGLTEATSPTHMTPHGRIAAGRAADGHDVDRRPRVQHRCPGGDRRGRRGTAGGNRRAGDRRAADHPGLLAEAAGDGGVAAQRRAAHRRRRLHGRAGLVLPGRSRQGHDRGVGLQGVAARSGGGAVPASRGARGGGGRRARPVSRRNDQGGGQPQAGHARRPGTRSRRSRASGWPPTSTRASWRSSTSCPRRRAARSCAACCSRRPAGRRRRCTARKWSCRRLVSAAPMRRRGPRGARSGRDLAPTEPRSDPPFDIRGAVRTVHGACLRR